MRSRLIISPTFGELMLVNADLLQRTRAHLFSFLVQNEHAPIL